MKEKLKPLQIIIVLVIASLVKVLVSPVTVMPFNADEAIVALMARHINLGSLPVFFYGQVYMGSLDALIVSLGFRIFGQAVWVIRLIQSLLYLGTIITVMQIAVRILKSSRAAFIAGLFMAVPPINVTLYSTVSLGGYGEMLLIGNLLILSGLTIIERMQSSDNIDRRDYLGLALWGLGAGFGFWVFGLTLIYILPLSLFFVVLVYRNRRKSLAWIVLTLGAGFILGSVPWWSEIIRSGDLGVLIELAGGAIRGAGTGPVLIRPIQRLLNLVVFGGTVLAGLRPPWDIRWLIMPLLPFVMFFWLVVIVHSVYDIKQDKGNPGKWLLAGMGVILVIGFLLTPYGDDPSGRYFVPLITPMVIFAANLIHDRFKDNRLLEILVISLVLIYNLGGTIQSYVTVPPGLTTQFDKVAQVDHRYMKELINFLEENKIDAGYSNYWVSYPLAFLSNEEIIFLPRLPYHEDFRYTARDDRYPPYRQVVKDAESIAYITTNHPDLNDYLRAELSGLGVEWKEKSIGDYQIFFDISDSIHVEQLGLGETTDP